MASSCTGSFIFFSGDSSLSVGKGYGGRGVGQQRASHDKRDDAYYHERTCAESLVGYLDEAEPKKRHSVKKKDVEHRCKKNYRNDRFKTFYHQFKRYLGQQKAYQQKNRPHCKTEKAVRREKHTYKYARNYYFEPRIETVHGGVPGEILPYGYIFKHFSRLFSQGTQG